MLYYREMHVENVTHTHTLSLSLSQGVLRQGNRIPPDQVAKCKERKQLLDQICNRDADAMKRTCVARQSAWCLYIYLHECVFVHHRRFLLPPSLPLSSLLVRK